MGWTEQRAQRRCITSVVVISTVPRVAACMGNFETRSGGLSPVALECHVGDVQRNVFSVSRLVDQGCNVNFGPDGCWIRHKGRCVNLHRQGGLFTLRVERPKRAKGPRSADGRAGCDGRC